MSWAQTARQSQRDPQRRWQASGGGSRNRNCADRSYCLAEAAGTKGNRRLAARMDDKFSRESKGESFAWLTGPTRAGAGVRAGPAGKRGSGPLVVSQSGRGKIAVKKGAVTISGEIGCDGPATGHYCLSNPGKRGKNVGNLTNLSPSDAAARTGPCFGHMPDLSGTGRGGDQGRLREYSTIASAQAGAVRVRAKVRAKVRAGRRRIKIAFKILSLHLNPSRLGGEVRFSCPYGTCCRYCSGPGATGASELKRGTEGQP